MENLTLVKRLGLMKVKLMFVCKYRDENVSVSRKQSWIVALELLDLIRKEINTGDLIFSVRDTLKINTHEVSLKYDI